MKSNKIIPNTALKTFDFGSLAGQKQTKEWDDRIHDNIINNPDSPMAEEGESFNEAFDRAIPEFKKIIENSPNNTTVLTHNSVFGLFKLWDKVGRPDSFTKEQREMYTKQDNKFGTGAHFTVKTNNGDAIVGRHGEAEGNQKGNFREDTDQLTDKGIKQAKDLGKALSKHDIPQIITSPLDRTIETSNIIMDQQKKSTPVARSGAWLDNYGEEENANEGRIVSGPDNTLGTTDKGRNYSPAWGGQFANGGKMGWLDNMQKGGKFLQPDSEKLPEGQMFPFAYPSSELAATIGGENGEPAYLVPTFKYGKPLYNFEEEFKKTGEHLGGPFKTWQEADKWEMEVRHPAVEKREKIQFPIKEFAMGGSMPGSVGFSYARTGTTPSEGPRGRKTIPSAKNGDKVKDEREGMITKKDNISTGISSRQKKGLELKAQEAKNQMVDQEELHTTGTIKNPKSIAFKKNVKQQPMLSQETRSPDELRKSQQAMENVHESNLYGERPLLYLANPTKMLGDIGVPGYEGTEKDRERIMLNRYDPTKTNVERMKTHLGYGMEEVPSAALNVGLSTMAVGEAATPTLGRVLGESLNPIPLPINMGMKDPSAFWRSLKNDDDVAGLLGGNKEVRSFMDKGNFLPDEKMGAMIDFETGARQPYNTETKKYAQDEYIDNMLKYHESPEFNRIMDQYYPNVDKEMYKAKSLQNLQERITINPNLVDEGAAGVYKPKISTANDITYTREARVPLKKKLSLANKNPFAVREGEVAGRSFVRENPERETINHELRHQQTNAEEFLPEYLTQDYLKENLRPTFKGDIDYLTHETEFDTRLKLMKEDIKNAGINDYFETPTTIEHINGLRRQHDIQSRGANQLFHMYTPEFLAQQAKNLPAVVPIGLATGAAATQFGGTQQQKTGVFPSKAHGGVVRDNMGFWNPQNNGKTVEIDGTDITMEGLNDPVYAISDVGDERIMYPGENHKFKGKKVREKQLSMAKDGNQLTKLDQLTNFTNYNTKQPGGWLDNL